MFESLKKALFVEIPDEKEVTPAKNDIKVETKTTPSFTSSSINSNPSPSIGVVDAPDETLIKHFTQIVDGANIPAPNYNTFRKTLNVTEPLKQSMAMNDVAHFQFTFAQMSATTPISKDTLLNTANKYLDVLKKDNDDYAKLIEEKKQTEIVSRQNQINDINSENQKKQNQIDQLNKDIQENQVKMTQINNEIIDQNLKIDQKVKAYNNAYASATRMIGDDITKIEQYIS